HSCHHRPVQSSSFLFNATATTNIYTLSLHDALPICPAEAADLLRLGLRDGAGDVLVEVEVRRVANGQEGGRLDAVLRVPQAHRRSEEHTSELQSRENLVCRLLLEKKNKMDIDLDVQV